MPDACIDIVIDFVTKAICFAGFSKETEAFELRHQIDYMGVRLKPSLFYLIFKIEADQIMDHQISFRDIENEMDLYEIFNLKNTEKRIEYLKNYLLQKTKNIIDMPFLKIVEELYKSPKEQTVINISEKFGYHQRQLYRIFKANYGVSPKVLLNISFKYHKK